MKTIFYIFAACILFSGTALAADLMFKPGADSKFSWASYNKLESMDLKVNIPQEIPCRSFIQELVHGAVTIIGAQRIKIGVIANTFGPVGKRCINLEVQSFT